MRPMLNLSAAALDLVREAVGRADDEGHISRTAVCAVGRNWASSSEEICFPSMHMATIAAPLRTLPRMALPSLSSAFSPQRRRRSSLRFFLPAARRCGKTQTPPDVSGIRPRPRRSYFALSLPTQIRSIFCMVIVPLLCEISRWQRGAGFSLLVLALVARGWFFLVSGLRSARARDREGVSIPPPTSDSTLPATS